MGVVRGTGFGWSASMSYLVCACPVMSYHMLSVLILSCPILYRAMSMLIFCSSALYLRHAAWFSTRQAAPSSRALYCKPLLLFRA